MADETVAATAEIPAASAAETVSPAAAQPGERAGGAEAAAPAVASPSPEAPETAAPGQDTPSAETAAPAETEAKPTSLLGEAVAASDKQPEPEKPTEAPPEATPASQYEPFTLPEGFSATPDQMAAYTGLLSEANVSQEIGQKLIDLHIAEISRLREAEQQRQRDVFNEMRTGWRDEFERDPQIGGNRRQTTLNSVVGFLRHYASDADHLQRVMQVAEFTGWGDNPDMIKLFANAAKGLAQQYREGAPVRAERPAPMATPRYRQRYAASAPNGSSR